jgi:hypothetical protein
MTDVISFPFRLLPSGQIATVDDGSPEGQAEELAVLVSTKIGERSMVQSYGLSDPVFVGVSAAELRAQVANFGPAVTIDDIAITYPTGTSQQVAVTFT